MRPFRALSWQSRMKTLKSMNEINESEGHLWSKTPSHFGVNGCINVNNWNWIEVHLFFPGVAPVVCGGGSRSGRLTPTSPPAAGDPASSASSLSVQLYAAREKIRRVSRVCTWTRSKQLLSTTSQRIHLKKHTVCFGYRMSVPLRSCWCCRSRWSSSPSPCAIAWPGNAFWRENMQVRFKGNISRDHSE